MNSVIRTTLSYQNKRIFNAFRPVLSMKKMSTEPPNDETQPKKSGYAKAFDKFEAQIQNEQTKSTENQTFSSLLRNSKFIDMGDPSGKVVTGKVFKIIDDDLYIDFGWKFHCVCPRPKKLASSYVRGSRVRLLIKDLELSSKFLGYEKDITLLEADTILLGLVQDRSSPINKI